MNIYTIGFTQKTAAEFFGHLSASHISTLIDVRINNVSQLSGFAKKNDLKFFLRELCGASYIHFPDLAPTKDLLKLYKNRDISWESYEGQFLDLMEKRNVEKKLDASLLDDGCLLCSEHKPHFCHRRLVVEYLNNHTDLSLDVRHLF